MRRALWAALAIAALAACSAQDTAVRADDAAIAAPLPEPRVRLAPRDLGAFFDCLASENATLIAAHRGGPTPGYAENALSTFAHTLSQAPVALEIDVSQTSDGVLVLMHDDTVDRTTTGEGAVAQLSAAQFAALRLEDNGGLALDETPPTLAEALQWADGRTILELDVKRGARFEDVVAAVRAARAEQRVIIITYTDAAALRVHRLAPELMLSVSVDDAEDLPRLRAQGINPTRVLAWGGVREVDGGLNRRLQRDSVESLFGTLGRPGDRWDDRIARGERSYRDFASEGVELIATDAPVAAANALGVENERRILQCAATGGAP